MSDTMHLPYRSDDIRERKLKKSKNIYIHIYILTLPLLVGQEDEACESSERKKQRSAVSNTAQHVTEKYFHIFSFFTGLSSKS
jgi:hypothetical protein